MAEVSKLEDRRRHSVAELMHELTDETRTLVRQEVELAKTEMTEKARQLGVAGGLLATAGVLGFVAFGALTAAAIAALALVVAVWLASLIVAAVYLIIAAVLGAVGYRKLQRNAPPTPDETVETVREDVQWLKQKSRSATK